MSREDASRRETDDRRELESLVSAAMEQRLDADGFRRLDELVGSDVALAHACVEQLDLQSAMVEFAEDVRPDDTIRKVIDGSRSSKRPTQGVRRQTLTVALSLATALALAAVCVPLVVIGSRATPVATVEALSERADVEGVAFGVGSILNRGARSRIEAGVATFRTESGVVLDVRGPAIVAWRGADRVELINGTLRASVPPSGVGFTVVTERAEIVDLGTEFVVGHRLTEETHVGVLSGRVDTYVWDAGRERTRKASLVAGETVVVTADNEIVTGLSSDMFAWFDRHVGNLRSVSGTARIAESTPPDLRPGGTVTPSHVLIVPERRGVVLTEPLTVESAGGPIVLPAGRAIRSYLVHFDPLAMTDRVPTGNIKFGGRVAGLLADAAAMTATDTLFGLPEVDYSDSAERGLEGDDEADVVADGDTVRFDFNISLGVDSRLDQFRILTFEGA